jgi:thiol:disulfide interchange protein
MTRTIILAALIAAAPLGAGIAHVAPAFAADKSEVAFVKFTQPAFDAARARGQRILIDVHAPWCPVCARQQPGIAAAQKLPANRNVVVFRIDFDSQKDVQRPLGVTRQSTLIAYKGKTETGRLLGETDPAKIARLVASTR